MQLIGNAINYNNKWEITCALAVRKSNDRKWWGKNALITMILVNWTVRHVRWTLAPHFQFAVHRSYWPFGLSLCCALRTWAELRHTYATIKLRFLCVRRHTNTQSDVTLENDDRIRLINWMINSLLDVTWRQTILSDWRSIDFDCFVMCRLRDK